MKPNTKALLLKLQALSTTTCWLEVAREIGNEKQLELQGSITNALNKASKEFPKPLEVKK